MQRSFSEALWLLGFLLAIPVIVSLIDHTLHIGLAPAFDEFVTFYRRLVAPAFDLLYAPLKGFGVHVPVWLQDVHTLSLIGGSLLIRSWLQTRPPRTEHRVMLGIGDGLMAFIWGTSGFGLYGLTWVARAMFGERPHDDPQLLPWWREMARFGWGTLGAVITFYVANYAVIGMAGEPG